MDAVVSVEDEPMHHELWRTPTVRVLRADFPPRASCLWHEHVRRTIYVCVTAVDVLEEPRDGPPARLQLARGQVLSRDHSREPFVHRATTDDDRVVLVGVELYAPRQALTTTSSPVLDGLSKCVFSDDYSRVDRLDLLPDTPVAVEITYESVLVALDTVSLCLRNQDTRQQDQPFELQSGAAMPFPIGRYVVTADAVATVMLVQAF